MHPDHLDKAGVKYLVENDIAVIGSKLDEKKLNKKGIRIENSLNYWEPQEFLNGQITGIPALHGYGFISKPMGNVMGYTLKFADNESIYISSDTIYTPDIDRVFNDIRPDIAVLAAGTAQFDFGGPLLMNQNDIMKIINNAPGRVYANHMDAVNHCAMTRIKLKELLHKSDLSEKVAIPQDGESFEL